jgi:hypothetical protein
MCLSLPARCGICHKIGLRLQWAENEERVPSPYRAFRTADDLPVCQVEVFFIGPRYWMIPASYCWQMGYC